MRKETQWFPKFSPFHPALSLMHVHEYQKVLKSMNNTGISGGDKKQKTPTTFCKCRSVFPAMTVF